MQSSTQVHREALQRQTQQDWANREYIELVSIQPIVMIKWDTAF